MAGKAAKENSNTSLKTDGESATINTEIETASMKKARALAKQYGVKVRFFAGNNLMINGSNGGLISARGAYVKGKHILVRVDHPLYTAEQLMRHELCHYLIDEGKIDLNAVRERLKKIVGEENIERAAKFYADAYQDSNLTAEEIWEECVCDSLGDMNIFAGDVETRKFMEDILPEIKTAAESQVKETSETRGPPELKTSRETKENYLPVNKRFSIKDYGKKNYNNYGWVRYNDIISDGYWNDFTSKFADLKSGRANFYKTTSGEYIIPINDGTSKGFGIDNVLVYAKGTISSPIVSKIVKIDLFDEVEIESVRRSIYESKGVIIEDYFDGILEVYEGETFSERKLQRTEVGQDSSVDRRDEVGRGTSGEAGRNESGVKFSRETVEEYTEQEYNDYGWARYNEVLSASENADLRSKFAAIQSKQARYPKSKAGEYMIEIGDDVHNKIAYMKGTIEDPVITRILEIDENNETELDKARRDIYAIEQRGIQRKTGGPFYTYTSASFGNNKYKQRSDAQSARSDEQLGADRGGNSRKTSRPKEYIFGEDGSVTEKYSRELDYIDFINEQEDFYEYVDSIEENVAEIDAEIKSRLKNEKALTNRQLLTTALENISRYPKELGTLGDYRAALEIISKAERRISDIDSKLKLMPKEERNGDAAKLLKAEKNYLAAEINHQDEQLLSLEAMQSSKAVLEITKRHL